jgi:hypothetical protein
MTKGKNTLMNKDNVKKTMESFLNYLNESKKITLQKNAEINEQIEEFINDKKNKLKWEKKEKKSKDPNAPTKPKNAYIFYSSERRPQIKAKNKDMNPKEITKQISEEWNKMTEKQKKKYNDLAADDRVRYANEMKDYKPIENIDQENKGKRKTGYILYCQKFKDIIEDNPDLKPAEIKKKLAQMWKDLSKDDQKKYNDEAKISNENIEVEKKVSNKKKSNKNEDEKPKKKEAKKKDLKKEEEIFEEEDEDDKMEKELEKIESDLNNVFKGDLWDYDNTGLNSCFKGDMTRIGIEKIVGKVINYKDDCEYEENDAYPVVFVMDKNKLMFRYSENDEDEIQDFVIPTNKMTKELNIILNFLKKFK